MPDNVKDNPVGKREALLADRLRLHKGYRYTEVEIFSKGDFTLSTNWFEGEVTVGDVTEFFQRSGDTLYDIVPALMDDGADITSYDDLKRFAIEKIESDELYLAEHVLKACLDVADYYGYDYSMGTLEKPTAIDGVEDLIDYVED